MKNKWFLISLFYIFTVLFTSASFAQNVLPNPGFETGKTGWKSSGGTFAITATAPNFLIGKQSASFVAAATAQYFESNSIVVPKGLYGSDCMVSVLYSGADANAYLTVMDGSSVELIPTTARGTLNATTGLKTAKVYFTCPSSGSFKLRVQSTAAMVIGYFDDAVLGKADFQPVKQAQFIGQVTYGTFSLTLPAGTGLAIPTNASQGATYSGSLSAPTANRVGFTLSNPRAGRYVFKGNGIVLATSVAGTSNNSVAMFFGSNDFSTCGVLKSSGNTAGTVDGAAGSDFSCEYTLGADVASKEVYLQSASNNNTNGGAAVFNTTSGSIISVYFFPSGNDTVVNSKCPNDLSCENEFSAEIANNGSTCVANFQNLPWIATAVRTAIGQCTFTFSSTLILSNQMNCTTSTRAGATGVMTNVLSPSNTGFQTYSLNTASAAATDTTFGIKCSKASTDFKAKQNITGFFSSVFAPAAFYATTNSGQAIAHNTTTTVIFNVLGYETNPGSYNTSTGAFTVPSPGKYECHCMVGFASMAPGASTLLTELRKNGGTFVQSYLTTANITNLYTPAVTGTETFTTGDTITCIETQNTNTTRTLATTIYNNFSCKKVAN